MKIKENWLSQCDDNEHHEMVESYLEYYERFLKSMPMYQQHKECLSGYNRMNRMRYWSSQSLGVDPKVGDLCYLDYGHAYINEAGYQHFGLVISVFNYKLLVVPMTSNKEAIKQARNVGENGKDHLFYIGQIPGLNKPSVLFLNDCKFINSARVISVNGHIPTESDAFQEILKHIRDAFFMGHMLE